MPLNPMFWWLSFIPHFMSGKLLLLISLFSEGVAPTLAFTSTGIMFCVSRIKKSISSCEFSVL